MIDLGDIVIHLFSSEQRDYYRLEELLEQGKGFAPAAISSISLAMTLASALSTNLGYNRQLHQVCLTTALLDNSLPDGFSNRLGAVGSFEFFQNMTHMRLDSIF